MVSKIKVAFALLLVTIVPVARATSDDEVVLTFPALDTLTAATSRYLKSTESMITTNEGNSEERANLNMMIGKVVEPLESEMMPLLTKESEEVKMRRDESEDLKMLWDESKNIPRVSEALWKWKDIFEVWRKDSEVEQLIKDINGIEDQHEINEIVDTVENKYFDWWLEIDKSADDIFRLLGLEGSPDLVKEPLLRVWMHYAARIEQSNQNPTAFLDRLAKKFGEKLANEIMVKVYGNTKNAESMLIKQLYRELLKEGAAKVNSNEFAKRLESNGITDSAIAYWVKIFKLIHPDS